ncbi:unnamed protein product, partial [Ixodes persulcatus]
MHSHSKFLASALSSSSSSLALSVWDDEASTDESPRDDCCGEAPRLPPGAGEGLLSSSPAEGDATPPASNSRLAGSLLARSKSHADRSSSARPTSSSESRASRTPLRFSREEGAPS